MSINKIKTISLIFIIIVCTFCSISYANNKGKVYLTSTKNIVEKEEEIEIIINLEDNITAAFTSYLYFDNTKVEYISGPDNTNLVENHIIHVWHDTTGGEKAKKGELAKFKFKAKENGIANFIIEGEFYNNIGQLIQVEFKQIQLQIGKEETKLQKQAKEEQGTSTQIKNTELQTLRLDKEGLTPEFNKNIYEYYLTITNDINNIDVLATPENPKSTIEITGNTNLKQGLNNINIKVISEDKTESKDYVIQVTKTDDLELANTNLETLAIQDTLLYPEFNINTTKYKAEVSNEIKNLNILAIPENEKATVEIQGKDNIKEGNNLIKINVIAPNGFTTKKYEIIVYKRNQEEEMKYVQEQKDNEEKLEEIYKAEKLSNEDKKEIDDKNLNNKKKNMIPVVIFIALAIAVVIGIKKDIFTKLKNGFQNKD